MLNCILIFLILISVSTLYAENRSNFSEDLNIILDLETMAQDFVIETKQLQIPGHPNACNPSLIRWHNQLLLSFDAYIERDDQPDGTGLVYLDDNFNVIGAPQILDLPMNLWQDSRLITMADRLYMVFNGAINDGIRRMFIAQIRCDAGKFIIDTPEVFLSFPGENAKQWERNWTPFTNNDTLFLTYSLVPHKILKPFLGTQRCEEVSSKTFSSAWNWGIPKPGTSAHLDGDHYLALFHSIKVMATAHSEGKPIQHYFMGAYTFENHPPFAITSISRRPIVGKNFYRGQEYDMIKPCRVVFPCGFVIDDQFIWVVFGRQDHEVWMAKIEKNGLYNSLMPVVSE